MLRYYFSPNLIHGRKIMHSKRAFYNVYLPNARKSIISDSVFYTTKFSEFTTKFLQSEDKCEAELCNTLTCPKRHLKP